MALFSFGKKDKNSAEPAAPESTPPPAPPKVQTPPAPRAAVATPSIRPPQPAGLTPANGAAGALTTQPMVVPKANPGLKPVRPGTSQSSRSTQRIVLPSGPGGKPSTRSLVGLAAPPTPAGRINLPIGMILRALPAEALVSDLSVFENSGAAATEISLSVNTILSQLPSGKVEILLEELVPLFPAGFLQPGPQLAPFLSFPVNLPLMDVVMRIPPDLLALRSDQKEVDAAVINMADPFTEEILREQAEAARRAAAGRPNIIEESQVPQTEEFVPQAQADPLPKITPPAPAGTRPAPPAPPRLSAPTRATAPIVTRTPGVSPAPAVRAIAPPTAPSAPAAFRPPVAPAAPSVPALPRPAPPLVAPAPLPTPVQIEPEPVPEPTLLEPQIEPLAPEPTADLASLAALAMAELADNEAPEPTDTEALPAEDISYPEPELELPPEPVSEPVLELSPERPAKLEPKLVTPKPFLMQVSTGPLPAIRETVESPSFTSGDETAQEALSEVPEVAFNLNTCRESDLVKIPGCNPVLAAAIVAYRAKVGSFRRLEDLHDVPGMTKTAYINLTGDKVAENALSLTLNDLLGFPASQNISLKDVTDRILCWPDVTGCVMSQRSGLFLTGSVPAPFEKSAIVAFAPRIFETVNKSFTEIAGREADEVILPTLGTSFHFLRKNEIYLIILSRLPQMPDRHLKVARLVVDTLGIKQA